MAEITQEQYLVVKQKNRKILLKIDLLVMEDSEFKVVDSIEGSFISGTISIDANSDIRRSCSIEMIVKNSTFEIKPGSAIWLDKYFRIYYGIINNATRDVVWTNLGIFLINNPAHVYNATNNTISFTGLDLMAKITGLRSGYYTWLTGTIPAQAPYPTYPNIDCTLEGNIYSCEISDFDNLEEPPADVYIGIGISENIDPSTNPEPDSEYYPYLKINNMESYPIYQNGNPVQFPQLEEKTYYVVYFVNGQTEKYFNLLGLQDETIRDIFVDLIQQAGFKKYNIEEIPLKLPYDVQVTAQSSLYNVFVTIRNNLLPNYEMFFDTDGVFNLKKIRNNESDPIIIDNDLFDKITIDVTNDVDFENVKNVIEIWGRTIEPTYGNPICSEFHYVNLNVEQGSLNSNTGIEESSTTILRTGFLKFSSYPTTVTPTIGYKVGYRGYNSNFEYLGLGSSRRLSTESIKFTEVSANRYIRLLISREDGATISVDEFDNAVTFSNSIDENSEIKGYYAEILSLNSFHSIPTNSYIGFGIKQVVDTKKPYLKINEFDAHPIIKYGTNEFAEFEEPETIDYYIVMYFPNVTFDSQTGVFGLVGYQEIHYIIKDTDENSAFNINKIGEIVLPLCDGEYNDIQTLQQAKDRAEWELYNYDRMNDKIRLTTVTVPWVDVNQKIKYVNEKAGVTEDESEGGNKSIFIIKNVTMDLAVDGNMTLECIRWYDYDPWDEE